MTEMENNCIITNPSEVCFLAKIKPESTNLLAQPAYLPSGGCGKCAIFERIGCGYDC